MWNFISNFFKTHKPLSALLAVVVMSLLALTAFSVYENQPAYEYLILVFGSFTITYAIYWFQTGRTIYQFFSLIVVSLLAFGLTQIANPAMTIGILSGIIAAGLIEILFEVVFGFIANNIRAEASNAAKAEALANMADTIDAAVATKVTTEVATEVAKVEKEAREYIASLKIGDKNAPAQPAVNQNKLIVWFVNLVMQGLTEKEYVNTEAEAAMKRHFAQALVESIVTSFPLALKGQSGGVRRVLKETLQAGYMVFFDRVTEEVAKEKAVFTFNFEEKNEKDEPVQITVYLAPKASELATYKSPTVDAAIAAETQAQAKTEPKKHEAQAPAAQGQKSQGTKPQFRANRQVGNNHKAT